MSQADVAGRLTTLFMSYFTSLTPEETPRASMATVGEWDSMAAVTLMALVAEEFAIQIPPEDFEKFTSFELILDYLVGQRHVS